MAINYRSINYGLPGRYTKLPVRKLSTKKTIYSKCLLKTVELFNPDPMPYQKDLFKPCTVSRLVDIPRRVNDGFIINDDLLAPRQRGIILHKDRYDWSSMKDVLSNQNERLAAEENYIKKAKDLKKLSDQKLKSSTCQLILEGENVLPINSSDRNETKKERNFYLLDQDTFRHPAPTVNTNYDDTLENIDLQQPVSMDVHQIKLKIRQFAGENISSAPAHAPNSAVTMPNMFIPPNGRENFDRLPPITSKQREIDPSFFNLSSGQSDFIDAYRQSERFNKPNVRLNEYVVDGVPVKFIERSDIQAELRCLRTLALPTYARDLFIGRGINLPTSHATKNPRGRFIEDNMIPRSQMYSLMKIDTPGGGSVTINTKTPPNKNFPPENTPNLKGELALETIGDDNIETQSEMENNSGEEFNLEDVLNSLSPNEDGFVYTLKLGEYLLEVGDLMDHERNLFKIILQSSDKFSKGQVTVILQTVKIIVQLNESFRNSLSSIDYDKIKLLIPHLLISLDPSQCPINASTFYEMLIDTASLSLTVENCKDSYSSFLKNIPLNENHKEDEILQSHILLFIPFLLLTT